MKAGEGSKSAAKRVEWGKTAFEGIKVLNEERGGENH